MVGDKPRILFVDDEVNILKALERSLHGRCAEWDLGFHSSVKSAVEDAADQVVDVLITDLAMPGMSGLDVVRKFNASSPETRCIILTGQADLQTATEIVNSARVFRFYTKPCANDVLIDGINSALADKNFTNELDVTPGNAPGNIVLDRLPTGVFQIAGKGEVVYMNQAAAETVASEDGLMLGHDQVLRASNSENSRKLHTAVHQVLNDTEDGIGALSIERPSMREALKVIVAPLSGPDDHEEPHAVVFVSDPQLRTLPSADMISSLFDLTPVESRLALELISGQRTEDIADAMGITVSSVRTYVKRVMEKTDTNRQIDLVRLLLATPQIIARRETGADLA